MKKILFCILFIAVCFKAYAVPLSGDLSIIGDLSITNGSWELISETDVTTPISTLTISGLNGDVDETYKINAKVVGTEGNGWTQLRLNGDGGSNYGLQRLQGSDAVISAGRNTRAWIDLGYTNALNATDLGATILHAKSGKVRTAIVGICGYARGTTIEAFYLEGASWNNTADNITSMIITMETGNIGTGSHIELWRKRS